MKHCIQIIMSAFVIVVCGASLATAQPQNGASAPATSAPVAVSIKNRSWSGEIDDARGGRGSLTIHFSSVGGTFFASFCCGMSNRGTITNFVQASGGHATFSFHSSLDVGCDYSVTSYIGDGQLKGSYQGCGSNSGSFDLVSKECRNGAPEAGCTASTQAQNESISAIPASRSALCKAGSSCATPVVAKKTWGLPNLSALAKTDPSAYRALLAFVADVPCNDVTPDPQNIATMAHTRAIDAKLGVKDYVTCPNGKMVIVGVDQQSAAQKAKQARLDAKIARQKALLARRYSATPIPITAALSADVRAFNDSPASQTPGCSAMANLLAVMIAPNRRTPTLGDEIINWSMEANAAKVCASDTRGSAAEHLPRFILSRACGQLRGKFELVNAEYRSETSWACGWDAPIPALRTVPGIMPPGYDQ